MQEAIHPNSDVAYRSFFVCKIIKLSSDAIYHFF